MGALDIQIAVKRDAAENIVATLELSKDGEAGAEIVSRLAPVLVGVDEDQEPVTSCVIVAADTAPASAKSAKGIKIPKTAQAAFRALEKAIAEVGEVAPASNHIPPAARVVTVDQWRTYAYQSGISDTDNDDARRMAFKRAHATLIGGKHVVAWDNYRWPT